MVKGIFWKNQEVLIENTKVSTIALVYFAIFNYFIIWNFSAHQAHYEQFGDLHGNVNVNGTSYKLEMNVMRDHTHGSVRDWRLMHRYGIQNFTTSNGFR